jgi:mRNA interferase RelE/StbE
MTESRRWEIVLARQPEKILRRLPRGLLQRVEQTIESLAENPRPPGCKRLVGHRDLYRVRVGDWRIIYAIEDDRLIVLIVKIAPRGRVYRDL